MYISPDSIYTPPPEDFDDSFNRAAGKEQKTPYKSPFLEAVRKGDKEAVLKELKNGADPNHETPEGLMPVHIALQQDNREIVKILIEYGCDVDKAAQKMRDGLEKPKPTSAHRTGGGMREWI